MRHRISSSTPCRIEVNGVIHDSIAQGLRIETRCGIIGKNLSMDSVIIKKVGDGDEIVTCEDCINASKVAQDVKE